MVFVFHFLYMMQFSKLISKAAQLFLTPLVESLELLRHSGDSLSATFWGCLGFSKQVHPSLDWKCL